jgi:DNA-directed RNA polymerase sigma subunit (sigma70/sigma32)
MPSFPEERFVRVPPSLTVCTLEQVAKALHIDRSTAWYTERRALNKLRKRKQIHALLALADLKRQVVAERQWDYPEDVEG